MPVITEYTSNPNGVILYFNGDITGEELIGVIQDVYRDNRFIQLKYWIGDHSECENIHPTIDELMEIGMMSRIETQRNPGILLALVAPRDNAYGICRQYEPLNDHSEFVTQVFKNRDEAEAWIAETLSFANHD